MRFNTGRSVKSCLADPVGAFHPHPPLHDFRKAAAVGIQPNTLAMSRNALRGRYMMTVAAIAARRVRIFL